MISIEPGELRDRVDVQRDANHGIPAASGTQQAPNWVSLGVRWANVVPLSGRERFTAQAVTPEVTHRVDIRYDASLEPKPVYRIVTDGAVLEIESIIDEDSRKVFLHLMCKETVAA